MYDLRRYLAKARSVLKKIPLGFIIRTIIFIALAYSAVPCLVRILTPAFNLDRYPWINFFETPLFFALAFIIFGILKHKELAKQEYKQGLQETLIFALAAICLFALFLHIGQIIEYMLTRGIFSQAFNYSSVYLTYLFINIALFLAVFNLRFVKLFWKGLAAIIILSAAFYGIALLLLINGLWFI